MTELITLPGFASSEEDHWQSLWEKADPTIQRFKPDSWDHPDLENWIKALETCVATSKTPPVLVAHSLSCLLVAHWAKHTKQKIAGALLVAIPDPESALFPEQAASFKDVPKIPLPFRSLIVASSNDPYGSPEYHHLRARQWQTLLFEAGDLGHINSESCVGDWPEGLQLIKSLVTGPSLRTF